MKIAQVTSLALDICHKTKTKARRITVEAVFVSNEIEQDLKRHETTPPIVNQKCVDFKFPRDMCGQGYGFQLPVVRPKPK